MKRVLLFGGTTEGRELAEKLPVIYCAVSDYGAQLVKELPSVEVRVGRLDRAEMEEIIRKEAPLCAIDATHPYAREASRNIKAACEAAGLPLARVKRAETVLPAEAVTVASVEEAALFLEKNEGAALLATGSKELAAYSAVTDRKRLFARVLPDPEVISKAMEAGFDSGHIIAMQGPFSRAMNEETLRHTGASWLVTKDGGTAGGTEEKIEAARSCGARVIMVCRPEEKEGVSMSEALLWARRLLGLPRPPLFPLLTDLEGRKVLVAGGGKIAARRIATLLKCGALVTVVSPELSPEAGAFGCELLRRKWKPQDLEGMTLVTAATDDPCVNAAIGAEAKKQGIPVSVADDASACSFSFPSLVAKDEVAVCVSAGALSPLLTRRLADRLRLVWEDWVREERKELRLKDGQE